MAQFNNPDQSSPDEDIDNDEFDKAAAYLPQLIGKLSVSDDVQLFLYGRYKQATCGVCDTKRPGMLEFRARKKWDAWKALGKISKEQAKYEYIQKIKELDPSWKSDTTSKTSGGSSWVVASKPSDTHLVPDEQKTVYDWCQQGDVQRVHAFLNQPGFQVDSLDDQGMALLHWASDGGHVEIARGLLRAGADVNIVDADGQTALHYACACAHVDIVTLLLSNHANASIKDNDGQTPSELADDERIRALLPP